MLRLSTILGILEPFVLAPVAVVVLASLLPPQGETAQVVDVAADCGIFGLFFLHGAKLSREAAVNGLKAWRLHALTLALTHAVFPVLGVALTMTLPLDARLAAGFVFLSVLPSTVQSSIAFTSIAGGNVAAAVCAAALSNALGIVLTPLLAALLLGAHGGFSLGSVETIVVQLLLPFVLGHLCRPWLASVIARHKTLVGRADRGSILLVVYSAFGEAVVNGIWYKVSVHDLLWLLLASGLLLGGILEITTLIGRSLKLRREDAIVLLFCGSKKSLASGVPMSGVLFPPAQAGLMILPLMLFHQIQLIVCAALARRLSQTETVAKRQEK